ncbi:MAG: N-acetylmuramoyl-L-alanine amidase [Cyanobacteria bacterium J06642_2]
MARSRFSPVSWGLGVLAFSSVVIVSASLNAAEESSNLQIVYPPENHQTPSSSIFFIGTTPQSNSVTVNGQPVHRSPAGHFAPSFPLRFGSNHFLFTVSSPTGTERIKRVVTRLSTTRTVPSDRATILADSVQPRAEVWKQPGEVTCFEAIGTPNATANLRFGGSVIPLTERTEAIALPPANAILTGAPDAQPQSQRGRYRGCIRLPASLIGQDMQPEIELTYGNATVRETTAPIRILNPAKVLVASATEDPTVARNGPSTSYIRYSPWPKGVMAQITGRENDWLRTAGDRWIANKEIEIEAVPEPPHSVIGSTTLQQQGEWSVLRIPLLQRLPFNVTEEPGQLILEIDHASLQTDFFKLDATDPLVESVTWSQVNGDRVRYVLQLNREFPWGYDADYEGTTLRLRVRRAPQVNSARPLQGLKIGIDPGHGGAPDSGSRGPNGFPEKDVNLAVSQRLTSLLRQEGATVMLTRTTDTFVPLKPRAELQSDREPHLFLSIHYNALPDDGDAENTRGIATFWYYPHSRPLAQALHGQLLSDLGQPDYGHYFSSLAVIRATTAPSVLLELGFMINPEEFELITTPGHQEKTARAIVTALREYVLAHA